MTTKPTNTQIADVLERMAELLETQNANPFRVRAYREGAQTLRDHKQPVSDLVHQDKSHDLKELPGIGEGLAAIIGEYVATGKTQLLEDLEAKVSPEDVIARVPGLGMELARRIVDQLHIESLAELEEAAHDGRLATVAGFGPRRVEAVRTALAGMLRLSSRQSGKDAQDTGPSVELLLKIDEEYRQRARAGDLHKIAPRRFNPDHEAWLQILNTKQDDWEFTALYSNTAQAHELEKTDDWVVIYYERDGKERQNTVVTETQGPLKGKRVVRGRDVDNQRFYGKKD